MALNLGSLVWSPPKGFRIAILATLIPLSVSAADFYVNPSTGSNGNTGLTPEMAWKTITFGLTQVSPGATLNLAAGVYDATGGEIFPIRITKPTIIRGASLAQTKISNDDPTQVTIYVEDGAATIEIRGLMVSGGVIGIAVSDGSRNLLFDSILVIDSQLQGVEVKNGTGTVRDSLFLNCTRGLWFVGHAPSICTAEGCISAGHRDNGFNQDNDGAFIIKNCLSVGNNQGFWGTPGGNGVLSNLTVSRNRYGLGLGTGHGLESVKGYIIHNNILHQNSIRGINEETPLDDPELRNNQFFANQTNYSDEGSIPYNTEFEINNLVGNGTAVVENNIVADPLFKGGPSGVNSAVTYETDTFQSVLTDVTAQWTPDEFNGAVLYPKIDENTFAYYIIENDTTTVRVWGDIRDVNFTGTVVGDAYEIIDYRLKPGSPAIDSGYDTAVAQNDLDLDGNLRIAGDHVDIGAYEFGGISPTATPTGTLSPTPTHTLTATPTFTNLPYPTYTPYPTYSPLPTYTLYPTYTDAPTCDPVVIQAPGDLTGDGKADVEDLLELLRWWKR